MGVGTCLLSNEGASVKDALLQARIDGKSWKEIGEQFGYGSPGAARTAFKKITGVADFKIKGKALKAIVDKGLLDDLKNAVPKKPPVSATGPSAPAMSAAATEGSAGTFGSQAATIGDDLAGIMKKAFPDQPYKLSLQADDMHAFGKVYANKSAQQALDLMADTLDGLGPNKIDKANAIIADIKAGKYYSDITKAHGVSFAEVDALFWSDALQSALMKSDDIADAVWNAYKLKPTSEYGFKAVQDMVWDMRKLGASIEDIAKVSGVDDGVVKLILDNKWKLPEKGSKQYVGFPSPQYGGSSSASSQTAAQIIGESNNFASMTLAQADAWVAKYGQDLTSAQVAAIRRYTGSYYRTINGHLRKELYGSPEYKELNKLIDDITASMRPAADDVTVFRGVGSDTFPGGVPKAGDAFMDRGFMSTSYGDTAAFGGEYLLVIDVPKGTMSRAVHRISSMGDSEREILLNRNLKMVITGTKRVGYKTHVYMKVIL